MKRTNFPAGAPRFQRDQFVIYRKALEGQPTDQCVIGVYSLDKVDRNPLVSCTGVCKRDCDTLSKLVA